MTRANFVKKAQKDYPQHNIKKGESYYWWAFKFGDKHYSKTYPRPSQLTQSDFMGQVLSISEQIEDMTTDSEFETEVSEIISSLETLRDETKDKLSNMPDSLQQGPTGELLQSRVDSVQEMIDELEAIDLEIEEVTEGDMTFEKEEDETDLDFEERKEDELEEANKEKKEEVLSSIQEVCYNGE